MSSCAHWKGGSVPVRRCQKPAPWKSCVCPCRQGSRWCNWEPCVCCEKGQPGSFCPVRVAPSRACKCQYVWPGAAKPQCSLLLSLELLGPSGLCHSHWISDLDFGQVAGQSDAIDPAGMSTAEEKNPLWCACRFPGPQSHRGGMSSVFTELPGVPQGIVVCTGLGRPLDQCPALVPSSLRICCVGTCQ